MTPTKQQIENVNKIQLQNKKYQQLYEKFFEKCPIEKRELFNLLMIEEECGFPFADRLKKYIPELFNKKCN